MKAIILGGNGLVGRELTRQWLKRDQDIEIYVVSRSGNNVISHKNVHNIKGDIQHVEQIKSQLPNQVDYVVDLIGGPEKDEQKLKALNLVPAEVTIQLADDLHAEHIGFLGASLGPKDFINIKKDIISKLKATNKKFSVVSPTIIYGGERQDTLGKLIPLFKVLGKVSKNMKPVHVTDVALALLKQLMK